MVWLTYQCSKCMNEWVREWVAINTIYSHFRDVPVVKLSVPVQVIEWKLIFKMTYNELMKTVNPTHSLILQMHHSSPSLAPVLTTKSEQPRENNRKIRQETQLSLTNCMMCLETLTFEKYCDFQTGVRVIEGHGNVTIRYSACDFLLMFDSNYGSI